MNDMTRVIVPKSDQINADDLLSGPITITITDVKVAPGQEQPVSIYFEGSDKAYRCCKSMSRVLVAAWGPDASKYKGRSLTLYCDPKVKWGGMEVGGIRISHMSHIESAMTMALTVTRANKKPFTVKPIVVSASKAPAQRAQSASNFDGEEDTDPLVSVDQTAELEQLCKEGGRDLTEDFVTFGEIAKIAELPARLYTGAKKWITKQRDAERQTAGADTPA